MLATENLLESQRSNDPWLEVFLTNTQTGPTLERVDTFQQARAEFNRDPYGAIERLRTFATNVIAYDIAHAFLVELSKKPESYRQCWYTLQAAFIEAPRVFPDGDPSMFYLDDNKFVSLPTSSQACNKAAVQVNRFATNYNSNYAETAFQSE